MTRLVERRKIGHISQKGIAILYHGGCNDGFAGAWAAWKKFGDKADYIPMFRENSELILKGREVYFIDYTLSKAETERFIKLNKRVICIDHHITAKDAVMLTEKPSFSLNHSGAVLAWNYFHPGKKTPLLLKYIEDRDLWRWKMPKAKEILAGTNFSNDAAYTFIGFSKMVSDFEKSAYRRQCIKDGKIVKSVFDGLIEKMARHAVGVKLGGVKALAVNAPDMFAGSLGNYLVEKMDTSLAIIWHVGEGNALKVSLRSDDKVDSSKIAGKFGGGGHKKASGFFIKNFKKLPWQKSNEKT
jgi:oligoribonuclease NrnB/cAMP/cGMP phosphodiesterase (DHH superfamily)